MRELLHLAAGVSACGILSGCIIVMRSMLQGYGAKMIAALKLEHRP